jgi:hypothetical protein
VRAQETPDAPADAELASRRALLGRRDEASVDVAAVGDAACCILSILNVACGGCLDPGE